MLRALWCCVVRQANDSSPLQAGMQLGLPHTKVLVGSTALMRASSAICKGVQAAAQVRQEVNNHKQELQQSQGKALRS